MTRLVPRNRKRVAVNAARREASMRRVVFELVDRAYLRVYRHTPAVGPLEVASWIAVVGTWMLLGIVIAGAAAGC